MKIALLGSNGFLGKQFSELENVRSFNRHNAGNLARPQPYDLPWCEKYDLIIHCASTSDLIEQSIMDAEIIKWWRDFQPKATLVTFGSDACYSEIGDHSEISYTIGTPYSKWREYAVVKRSMLNLLSQVERPSYHFVITSLFGPGFSLDDNHLIHSLIKKMVHGKNYGLKVEVGNPGLLRECVFAPDVVSNVRKIVTSVNLPQINGCQVINLGSPKKSAIIEEIVRHVCLATDYPIENIQWDKLSGPGPYSKWMDSSYAAKLINFSDTCWEDALQETVEYHQNQMQEKCESPLL